MKKHTITFLLLMVAVHSHGAKYWIYFTDKGTQLPTISNVSTETIENRKLLNLPLLQMSDVPVFKPYLDSLKQLNIEPTTTSKWLNAVTARLAYHEKKILQSLSFVSKIKLIRKNYGGTIASLMDSSTLTYDFALQQINADAVTQAGLNGSGIAIGIIDGGFLDAPKNKLLQHVFDSNQFLQARDFVNPAKEDFFKNAESSIDWHGTSVWTNIAGYDSIDDIQYGLATDATFYLARTDHGRNEFREEEDYWVAALEWMDSLGVRIINSSLGYSIDFDDPEENYQVTQMDGHTSTVAKAAQIAADEKGMLIIVSAGNEGNVASWQVVSTPADAAGVLAVGATDSWGMKAGYSALGPKFLPYLKPDVACYSLFGTSFSAPVITGLAACILQQSDTLSNYQIIDLIKKSSHLQAMPNNYLGFGIPDANGIMNYLHNDTVAEAKVITIKASKRYVDLQHERDKLVVFHKTSDLWVKGQQLLQREEEKSFFHIKNIAKAQQSTVTDGENIWEIIWPQQ